MVVVVEVHSCGEDVEGKQMLTMDLVVMNGV